jgi:hypothetical protein
MANGNTEERGNPLFEEIRSFKRKGSEKTRKSINVLPHARNRNPDLQNTKLE